jgi:diguanylate cyclase (GGDEF)-like protein
VGGLLARRALPVVITTGIVFHGVRDREHLDGLVVSAIVLVAFLACWRSLERLRGRYRRLAYLAHSSGALAASITSDVVPPLLERSSELLRADRAELLLLPSESLPGRWLTQVAGEPLRDNGSRVREHPVLDHVAAGPALVSDPALLEHLAARSVMVTPLRSEEELVGVLVSVLDAPCHKTRRSGFDDHELDLARSLAAAATIALAQQRLLAKVQQEAAVREHQALHDPLTGLPNRRQLIQQVDAAVANGPVGLLVLDLDRFQDVNDTLGHDVADLVLLKVALRLGQRLDGRGAIVGRLSGDEFAVILPGCADDELAREVAIALSVFDKPFAIADTQLLVRATVGVSSSTATESPARLLQFAESAMYDAKRRSLEVAVHRNGTVEASRRRLDLVRELRKGLEQGGLDVVYQPQVDLGTGQPVGAEALLRWSTEEEGPISPEEFVTLAEQSGMGPQLNRYVLSRALRVAASWARDGLDLVMSVNVSPRGLADGSLVTDVPQLLSEHGVDPHRLVLEITEGSVMQDPAVSVKVLQRLADLGVGLSVDDFGTGYSSLGYLKRLPVDEVKIDRSFVMELTRNDDDLAIVAATVRLAHDLGLRVVAEGVEEAAAYATLRGLGCDRAQGYLLSRPVPLAELTRWLRTWPGHAPEILTPEAFPGPGVRLA